MRLYTFQIDGTPRVGAEADGRLIDLQAAHTARTGAPDGAPFGSMLDLILAGDAGLDLARQAVAFAMETDSSSSVPLSYDLSAVRVLAPLPRPGKILCSGVNYLGHLEENPGATLPDTPGFFAKLPSAVIGPGDPIVHPRMTTQLDYEVEFAAVIGKRIHRAGEDEAMGAAWGYTILHDVSARDVQFKAPQNNQITLGKNFDTFAPLGPCIVTADELTAPHNVRLRTLVNGRVLQDGSTDQWVFSLPYLLSFLSQVMTLEPGDIVTTGTPAGVGVFRKPPVFLQPGDVVRLEAEGIGTLENPVIAEA
jgi:2-keto-4-pentenoate hydratase/2-oxohepta-3-ene-1,7-dioic acid hydratase in catechol pathway